MPRTIITVAVLISGALSACLLPPEPEYMPGCRKATGRGRMGLICPGPSPGKPVGSMAPDARVVKIHCCPAEYASCPAKIGRYQGCHYDPNCRLECEEREPRKPRPTYHRNAGWMCDGWDNIVGGNMKAIGNEHRAFAKAYDISPETLWCLTNDDSLWEQEQAYTAACESGVEGSADAVLTQKLKACGAWPWEE